MMWSHFVICLLVGSTIASSNPAWKENSEYVYNIRGRTLASLHEVANQYSGIIYKAQLRIQPRSGGKLQGQISNAQYSQVHSHLQDGWDTYIPDSELSYKALPLSNHPFQIDMSDGVIQDLVVSQKTPNWEVNIIKSAVSQFQLNTNANNYMESRSAMLPEGDGNSAVFSTMEETITGKAETTYDIHPLPEYYLQSNPWLVPHPDLKGDGEIIEVVKQKNYSNHQELPVYHYGLGGMNDWDPATNQMGSFFIRESISRAILTGNLKRYTIQNSFTVNENVMSPSLNNKQKGSVVSMVNATLEQITSNGQPISEVSNPISLGNIVYTYDDPESQYAKEKRPGLSGNSNDRQHRSATMKRIQRSLRGYQDNEHSSSSSEESYKRDQPQLEDAPQSPLLPYTTGYMGMSVKRDPNMNIKKSVQQMAQQIGSELQNPESSLRKNTLSRFTIMTSLIRLLDGQELKQVAGNLYSQEQSGAKREAWTCFRDAVAEAGTGPALLTIQEWTQSGKVKEEEAGEIVSTMANSVREPTEEYMKTFFEFAKSPKVQSQQNLNDSALLSYSNLARMVYGDRKQSNRQYPVYSYGSFSTEQGRKFVEDSVIPYFTKQLHEAVSNGETHRIHAYIRALGNLAHPRILEAFKPYLEGEKQCSQFQRLLMVMAMDKMAETNPKVARSVLYRIYQNAGESQEVRVAAVYQLMRTSPPTDMLQRMASYTNVDRHEQVNAAVKSSIESASRLQGREQQWLRSSAEGARPLLIEKEYGMQHSQNYLRSYVMDELKLGYKQTGQYFGSEEGFYPKGLRYSIRGDLGGFRERWATLQAMVSSVDELILVAKYQTKDFQEQQQKQKQQSPKQKQNPFSSLKIAELLNMKAEEREQLEGNLYGELYDTFQQFYSFDNHSMEQLPEDIRKFEEEIKNGKKIFYTKINNKRAIALSFPTESGVPFLFTYDTPMVFKFEGRISGQASPNLSNDGKLQKPDTIQLSAQLGVTVNAKTESRLSFITPFDSQRYVAGFDKNLQVHFPLFGEFKIDMKNWQIHAEIQNKEIHSGASLFHYSTWPYTSRCDIRSFEPVTSDTNTRYIQQENLRNFDKVYGKEVGIHLRIQMEHERQFINIPRLSYLMESGNIITDLYKLWDDAAIQYGQINVQLLPEQSTAHKYVIQGGYQYKYKEQGKYPGKPANWHQIHAIPNSLTRRDSIIEILSAGIKSVRACAWDGSVEFPGSPNCKYSFLGGFGKSNVDPKSRLVFSYMKTPCIGDQKPYQLSLEAENQIPNTNGLDLTESLKTEPKVDTTVQVKFGENQKSLSKAELKFQWRRSPERKQYLQEQPMYKQCQREMREGNYQLPACANMTLTANLLDKVDVQVQFDNFNQELKEAIKTVYAAAKFNYYPTLNVAWGQGTEKDNQIEFQAQFDPDLRSVNVSVLAKDHKATINTIQVNEFAQKVFVVHPVFHLRSRLVGAALGLQTYRPICVADKTHVSTFNNRTYPAPLPSQWTLLLQYVPREASHSDQQMTVEEQFMYQPEHYAVLARQSPTSEEQKEIKITLSSPKTDFNVIDITMSPKQGSSGPKGKVTVNDKEVSVSDQKSHDVQEGYIQIYSLPNGEIKVEVADAFYVIYDGQRAKLTVVNDKFRDSTRGLCGTFNDDLSHDFLTPENCITGDYQDFIKSYNVEGGNKGARRHAGKNNECIPKQVPLYVNVISDQDYEKKGRNSHASGRQSKGTKFQTQYVENGDELCFTIRPVPVCSNKAEQRGSLMKNVPVHCVQNSNVAQMYKNQIDRGASPDFSHKSETKTVQIELPKSCSP